MKPIRGEAGSIVLGWLVRLTVVLAAIGLVAFDAIAIGVARMALVDGGEAAARSAQVVWARGGGVEAARAAALEEAQAQGVTIIEPTLVVGRDGSVSFDAQREVNTFLFGYIPGAKEWTLQEYTVTQAAPSPN